MRRKTVRVKQQLPYRSTNLPCPAADIVTETDQAIEAMVFQRLSTQYPTFAFIGEETFVAGTTKLTDTPTFICDPIDGTTNFVHGFPAFCISLALAVERQPVIGVVYNAFLDELYTGMRGRGAFVTARGAPPVRLPYRQNPEPLRDLSTCLVGAEWGSDRRLQPNYAIKAALFEKLARDKRDGGAMAQNVRSMGSAALNCAFVATGQLDLYHEAGPWAWDVAAGYVLVREAGGCVVGGNPGEWEVGVEHRTYMFVRGDGQEKVEGELSAGQKGIVEEFWALLGEDRFTFE